MRLSRHNFLWVGQVRGQGSGGEGAQEIQCVCVCVLISSPGKRREQMRGRERVEGEGRNIAATGETEGGMSGGITKEWTEFPEQQHWMSLTGQEVTIFPGLYRKDTHYIHEQYNRKVHIYITEQHEVSDSHTGPS